MIVYRMRGLPLFCTRFLTALLAMVFLAMSLCIIAPELVAHSENDEEALNKQSEELEREQQEIQQRLQDAAAELKDADEELQEIEKLEINLNKQIAVLSQKKDLIEQKISALTEQIAQAQTEIGQKEAEIERQEQIVREELQNSKERAADMQEMNDSGFMELLGTSNSLYEVMSLPEMIKDIYLYSVNSMDRAKREQERLENQKKELTEKKSALEESERILEEENKKLAQEREKIDSSMRDLEETKALAQQKRAEAAQNLREKQAELNAVKSQIAAILQRKKREEEAARQAATSTQENGEKQTAATQELEINFTGFICPLKSYTRISSGFGERTDPLDTTQTKTHKGVDFAAKTGTEVYAVADGMVMDSEYNQGGYGNTILIYHGSLNGVGDYFTRYAHLNSRSVQVGQRVKQGQKIGEVGSTGRSTGPHLHLELWRGEDLINPLSLIPKR